MFEIVDVFLKGEGNLCFSDERFGDIYWEFYEGLFLCCAADFEEFYNDIMKYLERFFENKKVFEDLLFYQKLMIALPSQEEKIFNVKYNWYEYFENLFNSEYLIPKEGVTTLKIAKTSANDWVDYAHKRVWYGKRYESTINVAEFIK